MQIFLRLCLGDCFFWILSALEISCFKYIRNGNYNHDNFMISLVIFLCLSIMLRQVLLCTVNKSKNCDKESRSEQTIQSQIRLQSDEVYTVCHFI